jgi:FdhD protein
VEDLRKSGFPYSLRPHRTVSAEVLYGLPEVLRQAQQVFDRTGGLHATGLFDLSGRLLSLHEDIGRHNATDKMIGTEWLAGRTPLDERVVLLSGRAGFEIVQKCLMAGVGILAAIGAPSSLAVDLALEYGMTLVGFLRNGRLNIYSVPERIV